MVPLDPPPSEPDPLVCEPLEELPPLLRPPDEPPEERKLIMIFEGSEGSGSTFVRRREEKIKRKKIFIYKFLKMTIFKNKIIVIYI